MLEKIVSGGQTGIDRSALDAAINLYIACGGGCPKGGIDELGSIPERYVQLEEISVDLPFVQIVMKVPFAFIIVAVCSCLPLC